MKLTARALVNLEMTEPQPFMAEGQRLLYTPESRAGYAPWLKVNRRPTLEERFKESTLEGNDFHGAALSAFTRWPPDAPGGFAELAGELFTRVLSGRDNLFLCGNLIRMLWRGPGFFPYPPG